MINVELQYRPVTWIPFYRRVSRAFPEEWEEMDRKQFVAVSRVIQGDGDELMLMGALLGIGERKAKRIEDFQRFCIADLLQFISESRSFDKWFFPSLVGLSGPADNFDNIKFGEFIYADSFLMEYDLRHNVDALDRLIAVLYRRKVSDQNDSDFSGDEREPFNENTFKQRIGKLSKIDKSVKLALLVNYRAVRECIISRYSYLFPPSAPVVGNVVKRKTYDLRAWVKVFEKLVGDDILNRDKWAEMGAHVVLSHMNESIKQSIKAKG